MTLFISAKKNYFFPVHTRDNFGCFFTFVFLLTLSCLPLCCGRSTEAVFLFQWVGERIKQEVIFEQNLEGSLKVAHTIIRGKVFWKILSCIWLFVTPSVAHQTPLSMEFTRQEYWSEKSIPSPGNLPDPRTEPGSPALQTDSLPSEPPRKPHSGKVYVQKREIWENQK